MFDTRRHLSVILCLGLGLNLGGSLQAEGAPSLLLIGQDATLVTSAGGTRIVSDPYRNGTQSAFLGDFPMDLQADAVTVSHPHADHDNRQAVAGQPTLINRSGSYQVGDIKLTILDGRHGAPGGPAGGNRISVFEVNGAKFVHLGDSGIVTDPEVLKAIENADVVLVVVGSFVIPIPQIMAFMTAIKARTVVPAHWETYPQLEAFLKLVPTEYPVARGGTTLALTPGMPRQVLVMTPLTLQIP
jgi:L-ascorbate metabolism protein UlaG (beta-lactamase superfamily)